MSLATDLAHNLASTRSPRDILSGLIVVMDAADVVVTSGKVQTFNGPTNITQGTAAQRAVYTASDPAFNNQPTALFAGKLLGDADPDYNTYQLPDLTGLTQAEVFVVLCSSHSMPWDFAGPHNISGLWDIGGTQNSHYAYPDGNVYEKFGTSGRYTCNSYPIPSLRPAHIYSISAQAGSWASTINGLPFFSSPTNTVYFAPNAQFGVGPQGSDPPRFAFNGKLAGLWLCSQVQNPAARAEMTAYLKKRYGIA